MRTIDMAAAAGAVALASPAAAETVEGCNALDYRNDGASDAAIPFAERKPLPPLAFLPDARRVCEIYRQPRVGSRLIVPVARFEAAGLPLKATVTSNSVTYTPAAADFDLAKERSAQKGKEVARLLSCTILYAKNYTCLLRPALDDVATATVSSSDGERELVFAFTAEELAVAPRAGSAVVLSNSQGAWEKTFKVDRMLAQAGVANNSLRWSGREARAVMDAMSDGEDLVLAYAGEDGRSHRYTVPAANFAVAFGLLRPTLREIAAVDTARRTP